MTEEYTLVLLTDTSKRAQEAAAILHRGRGIVGGPPLPSGGRGNVIINILWLYIHRSLEKDPIYNGKIWRMSHLN